MDRAPCDFVYVVKGAPSRNCGILSRGGRCWRHAKCRHDRLLYACAACAAGTTGTAGTTGE